MRQRANSRTSRKVPAEDAMAPPDITPALPIEEALASKLLANGEKESGEICQFMQNELQELYNIKSKLLDLAFSSVIESTKRKLNSIYEEGDENMPKKKQSLENAVAGIEISEKEQRQEPSSQENMPKKKQSLENAVAGIEISEKEQRQEPSSQEIILIEPLKQIDNIIMPPPSLPVKTKSKKAANNTIKDVETTVIRKSRRTRTIAQTVEVDTTMTRITRSSVRINSSKIVESEDKQDETIKTTTKKTRGKNKNTKASEVTIKREKSDDATKTDEEIVKEDTITNVDTNTAEVKVSTTDKDSTLVVDTKEGILINDIEMVEIDGHITINDSQNTIVEEPLNEIEKKKNDKMTVVFDNSMLNLENSGNTSTPDKGDKEMEVDEIVAVETNMSKKSEEKMALDATVVLEKSPTDSVNKVELPKVVFDETVVISSGKVDQEQNGDGEDDSVLVEDLSEVEETPPKIVLPKIINKETIKMFESPVKSRVKHFEKLAEIANAKSAQAATQNERKNTRSQNVVKKSSKDDSKVSAESEKPVSKINVKSTPNSLRKNAIKCNLPLPSKQIGSAIKYGSTTSLNKLLSPKPVSSSQAVAQAGAAKLEREAAIKREAYNKKMEELKKRREEDARNLDLKTKEYARLQSEKTKAAQERRMKEEEQKKQKEIRRQEEIAEKALKKAAKENEKIQKAKKIDQVANKTYELNSTTVLNSHGRVSNFITQPNKAFDEMMKCDEDLEENNASDKERKKEIELRKPQWAKKAQLDPVLRYHKYIKIHVRDMLYSTAVFSPNLAEIFPYIERSKLKRTSSAVWKTPPRCSMMPR